MKMADKKIITRVIHKHEIEANWALATNFVPMQGELIVYDVDSKHNYERIKIGDGVQNVNDLPFVNVDLTDYATKEYVSSIAAVDSAALNTILEEVLV
jgi:uncharacterized protein (UPF0212 family)